jgi:hypothetical protein
MRFLLALCLILRTEDDAHAILRQIGQAVGVALSRSDNYICSQDLSRFYYTMVSSETVCRQPPELPSTPMMLEDRLKLDVAVSQGGEIYSWHGERKFSASSVGEVVRQGPISSGSFTGYLHNIFGENGVQFQFKGRTKQDGVDVFAFDYEVPLASSHYEVQSGKGYERVPFHGSFSARTGSLELYSLTVTAEGDKLSPKTNICAAETRLTYQNVKIADHESLLPASFDLLIGTHAGVFTESKGRYSSCREYRGESTVSYDTDDNSSAAAKPAELQSEPLNTGLVLPIVLRTEIDEDTAYAGLPVEATLQHDVKIRKGEKLLRGATLRGTLTQFQIYHQPSHAVSLKMEFSNITDGSKLYLCEATHLPMQELVQTSMSRGRRMAPAVTTISDPADGSMLFQVKHLHLRKYDAEFITVAPLN